MGLIKLSLSPENEIGPTFKKRNKSVETHLNKIVIDACCDSWDHSDTLRFKEIHLLFF